MELLHPASCLLLLLFLLTRPGVTSADNNGPVKVEVKEGDDVVLPCSLGKTDLTYQAFEWRKDGRQNVFLYERGSHSNNGRQGQDPQFKGHVSHFEDELKHGNASIKIRNTNWEDRGKYSCFLPLFQSQPSYIELIVHPVLKKRNTKGASPKPYVKMLNDQTPDRARLQCAVQGASPKPTVEWKNSAGKVLTSEVTHQSTTTSKLFYITVQTYVTQTGYYNCVVTQNEIHHQVFFDTFVRIGPVVVDEGSDVVLPCSFGQTDLNYQVFKWKKDGQEVFYYDAGKHHNNGRGGQDPQFKGRVSHFQDELYRGNASIKIRNTKLEDSGDYSCEFPNLQNQIFHIKLAFVLKKKNIKPPEPPSGANTGLIAGWTVAAIVSVVLVAVV